MIKIRQLSIHIREQLNDAEKYMRQAIYYKTDDPKLAQMYFNLAKAEVDHATSEHDQVVRIINEYKGDPNTQTMRIMKEMWNWQHQQMIQNKAQIMAMISMYKT